jgi:hypothetical protein
MYYKKIVYCRAPKEMEIILRTTKFDLPPTTTLKPLKSNKDQDLSTIAKFLPPLKPKPQVFCFLFI